jgi:hypothetical protein
MAMNTVLWVAQGSLAVVFAASGSMKAAFAKDRLVKMGQSGIQHYDMRFIRFIAITELLGAVGLVAPWLLGTARVLTPLAALGLGVLMVGAAASHARLARENASRQRRELGNVLNNFVLLVCCVAVAAARFQML